MGTPVVWSTTVEYTLLLDSTSSRRSEERRVADCWVRVRCSSWTMCGSTDSITQPGVEDAVVDQDSIDDVVLVRGGAYDGGGNLALLSAITSVLLSSVLFMSKS